MTKSAKLVLKKETKGALMYAEIDEAGNETVNLMGTLYLRKSAVTGKPASITVTIEQHA